MSRERITAEGDDREVEIRNPLLHHSDVFTCGRQQFFRTDQNVTQKQLLFSLKPLSRAVNGQRPCSKMWGAKS